MPNRKTYRRVNSVRTGRTELLHREIAAAVLGRALLPGEVVPTSTGTPATMLQRT